MRPSRSLGLLLCAAALAPADETRFPFKTGDRVMFLGDSITAQYQYSSYVELYLTTRFPAGKMTFLNAGIGGDTATGGAARFKVHVLEEKPTVVLINFGMNDGAYSKFDRNRAANYARQTEAMLTMAKKAGVRAVLVSPNAVEVRARPALATYLETQKEFYAPLAGLAAKHGVPFVDQYAVTRKVLEKIAEGKTKVSPFPDGVHTSPAGGLLMAHTILTGLDAPATVSDAVIDAKEKTAKTAGCKVTGLSVNGNAVSFERLDEALPMPVDPGWRGILPYLNDLKDLNYYGLKVTGLKAGKYRLSIGGKEAGTFSDEQLSAGVNLGNLGSGPVHDQGMKVQKAVAAKNAVVQGRFNNVVRFTNPPDWLADVVKEKKPAELKKRMEKIEAMQAEVWKLAAPVAHRFELKPVE